MTSSISPEQVRTEIDHFWRIMCGQSPDRLESLYTADALVLTGKWSGDASAYVEDLVGTGRISCGFPGRLESAAGRQFQAKLRFPFLRWIINELVRQRSSPKLRERLKKALRVQGKYPIQHSPCLFRGIKRAVERDLKIYLRWKGWTYRSLEPLEFHGGELSFQEQEKRSPALDAQLVGRQRHLINEHAAIDSPRAFIATFQYLASRVILLRAILERMAQNQHLALKLLERVLGVRLRRRGDSGDDR